MRQSWETVNSVSAGHIIHVVTLTQPVGCGRPQRKSSPGPPHQESRALPTELPRHPFSAKSSILGWYAQQRRIFRLERDPDFSRCAMLLNAQISGIPADT